MSETATRLWTRDELLEGVLAGLDQIQYLTYGPPLSDNYISGITHIGKRETPVLYLSLANGQHFELRAKRVQS